jgi:hypothetical protein
MVREAQSHPARASYCTQASSWTDCDGWWPNDTYPDGPGADCADVDGSVPAAISDGLAGTSIQMRIQLRWSGPCRTNWARVWIDYGSYCQDGSVFTNSQSPYGAEQFNESGCYTPGPYWTIQVYAPSWPAQACAFWRNAGTPYPCTSWV